MRELNLKIGRGAFLIPPTITQEEAKRRGVEELDRMLQAEEHIPYLSISRVPIIKDMMRDFSVVDITDVVGTLDRKNEDGTYRCIINEDLSEPDTDHEYRLALYITCTQSRVSVIPRLSYVHKEEK